MEGRRRSRVGAGDAGPRRFRSTTEEADMGRDRCETCGGLGGPAGPCPECGELPAVEVVGLSETTPSEPTRVTTPVTARRTALVVVGLLVGLVALSMAWEG